MKSYTDLNQSKKLAKILPLESADMIYMPMIDIDSMSNTGFFNIPECYPFNEFKDSNNKPLPCWSLAALLNVIPYTIYKSDNEFYRLGIDKGYNDYAVWYNNNGFTITDLDVASDNFVDACCEMIIKLNEQKLL